MPDFPQELIDRFVDEFSESTEDLKIISLVGRPWLHRARYHLFHSITLAPRDPKEIREYYTYLKRKASVTYSGGGRNYYQPLSPADRHFLHSPILQNPQLQRPFLLSIQNTLSYVRGLRLESSIQIGGGRKISVEDYFHRYLGYGGDEYAENSFIMRGLSPEGDFYDEQQDRWNAVDLPWDHDAGLHSLSFRSLRYVHVQWSVFGWVESFPICEEADCDLPVLSDPSAWPGYQLGMLLKSNSDTLEHVSIDEYPGFQFKQWTLMHSSDALFDLLFQNAPKLKYFCLGGPMLPQRPDSTSHDTSVLSRVQPAYRTGEEIPPVVSDLAYEDRTTSLQPNSSKTLERFFLRGFDSCSTVLIEDILLNTGILSAVRTTHLGLSAMSEDFTYKVLFSNLRQSLTHLTFDLDKSTTNLKLRFSSFPKLECLQVMIDPRMHQGLEHIISSLYHSAFQPSNHGFQVHEMDLRSRFRSPVLSHISPHRFKLHIGFGPEIQSHYAVEYLQSVDFHLKTMIVTPVTPSAQLEPSELRRKGKRVNLIDLVTVNMPEAVLEDALPDTYQTGCLQFGKIDEWWSFRQADI